MTDIIHIALASDRNYLPFAAITIASVAANTERKTVIHFLYEELGDNDFTVFDFLKQFPHITLQKHQISNAFFQDWPEMRWSKAAYYRLILPDLLPDLNKIVYLDCDLCVLDDIGKLYDTDFDGKSIMAVITRIKKEHICKLGISPEDYFNSGVIVFSPKQWKENNLIAKFKQCFAENLDKLKYPDQDILNLIFRKDIKILHSKWNIITSTFRNEPVVNISEEEIKTALKAPGIVHFTGSHKPWLMWKSFHHPYALTMLKYAKIAKQKKICRILSFKKLIFPTIAKPHKKLKWDRSIIDRSLF
ncbi:MAG: glycosyltransferase family 8 protein [Lentisphaeria bacterium]|nr:glycosyltransferase family 8 protein [Lentisphaeria bacterium]